MSNLIVVRRKGNKVRVFDTDRAKMGPWQEIPKPSVHFLEGASKHLASLTVPDLRSHASWMGLTIPSKMRKAEVVDIVAVRTYFRMFTPGSTYCGAL